MSANRQMATPQFGLGANTGMPVMGDMMDRGAGRRGDDLRDPIGQINRLRQANQPIPESLQRAAFQFAAANNLDSDQLSKRLGVSVSDISQAAQGLGIQDQLPSSLGGTGFGEQAGQAGSAEQGSTQPTGLQKVADFISQGNKSDQDIYREMV
jgi:hypothetical protein